MKKFDFIFLLILITILPLITLLHPGLPITHDGGDHVARIANFYASLAEGNLIPRWAGNLNWGYGHPILMFLYPLPSYLASLFHLTGISLMDSTKLVFGVSYILSGLFMFAWLRNFLGKFPAFVGSIVYLYAPYRFVDLYVRGAIGEHAAFLFLPAICYFLLKFNQEKKFHFGFFAGVSLSTAGLILSHNAISLMFFPFVAIYILYLLFVSRKKLLFVSSIIGMIYGFALSAFFWIPAFLEGKYTLRDIVTADEALSRFVEPISLIYGPWNFGGSGSFSVQLGIIPWIFVLLLPIGISSFVKKRNEKNSLVFLVISFIFLSLSLFLMLEISKPVWEIVTTLQKFQFPWRFLSISVFLVAIVSAIVVYSIRNKNIQAIIFLLVLASSIMLTKDYWKAKGFLQKPESFYSGIYNSTTDTGESSPIWSVRFMEKRPRTEAEVIEGEAVIKRLVRKTNERKYEISAIEKSRIRENTLYFPGWKVYVDGAEQSIEFQDPSNRGLITFFVDEGKHKVDIIFGNTRLRTAADYISLASLLGLVLLSIGAKRKWLNI